MEETEIIEAFQAHLSIQDFPCVGAKASVHQGLSRCYVAGHMGCPKDDTAILNFLYDFVDELRAKPKDFYSAAVIFSLPAQTNEMEFDQLFWQRLQALTDLDSQNYAHDSRVSSDPKSSAFCYSLKQEAFFIVGLHSGSNRESRKFKYPVIVFNPHIQFENLRATGGYDRLKQVIRKRDEVYSGSVNPMLTDFTKGSAVSQYSGRLYDKDWECPYQKKDAKNK